MTSPAAALIGISLEGGLLPPSLLELIGVGSKDLKGSRPEDYHLAAAERLGDAASRKWLYLRGVYKSFRDRLAKLPETDPATSETREHWLLVLLSELGFGRVPYIRSGLDACDKTGMDKTYPISHQWEHVPMHLIGWHTNLDKRPTQHGRAPQSMLQEFLNVSEKHLWGLLSNGRQLRLLRDSSLLVGSSYVEFDLEAIFDGELYSDFFLLFALLHESRFELLPREDGGPSTLGDCWLERWRVDANETGIRAGTTSATVSRRPSKNLAPASSKRIPRSAKTWRPVPSTGMTSVTNCFVSPISSSSSSSPKIAVSCMTLTRRWTPRRATETTSPPRASAASPASAAATGIPTCGRHRSSSSMP